MGKIFGGFLLTFLEFNLTAGRSTVGLLPDFVGYLCILSGVVELADEGASFKKAKPFVIVMAVYSTIIYILNFLGITAGFWWLSIIAAACAFWISYQIIKGVSEIEEKYHADLNSKTLNITWLVMVIVQTASFLVFLIPVLGLLSIIGVIATIVFLIMFFQSCKVYNTIPGK